MQSSKILICFIFTVVLYGCANPSIVNIINDETAVLSDSAKIFVPRFEGNPDFVEESTDYFIVNLTSQISNSIIQGSALRAESTDINSGANLAPLNIAFKAANANGADVLIMGKVTSHSTSGTLNGFSTIAMYNVHTEKRIANFHRPSGLLFGYSEHQCVLAAVKRTTEDISLLFK